MLWNLFCKRCQKCRFHHICNISHNKTSVKAMSSEEFCNKTACVLFQDINKQKYSKIVVCLENCYPKMSKHLIQVPQGFQSKHSKVSKIQFWFQNNFPAKNKIFFFFEFLNFHSKISKKKYFLNIFEFLCQKVEK